MRGSVVMLPNTIKSVEDTILESYLLNKQAMSVPEIKESLQGKLGDTIIRAVCSQSTRVMLTEKPVKIMSKDCPGLVHQWRRVAAFHPSREWLVEIISKTRDELPHYIYDSTHRIGKR